MAGVPYGSVRGKMFFVSGQFTFAEQVGMRFSRVPAPFTQSWPVAGHAIKDLSQSAAEKALADKKLDSHKRGMTEVARNARQVSRDLDALAANMQTRNAKGKSEGIALSRTGRREAGGKLPEPRRTSGAGIHLPNPSYWPILAAFGVTAVFTSLMLHDKVGPIGIFIAVSILFFSIYNWVFEPVGH